MYTLNHIYHPSRGSHLPQFYVGGLWSDVCCEEWAALCPADKAAGYNMLDVVSANVMRMNGYSIRLKIPEFTLE